MIDHPGGHNHEENWDDDYEEDDNEVENYGKHPFFCEFPKLPNLGNFFFTFEKVSNLGNERVFFSGIPSPIREVTRCQLFA